IVLSIASCGMEDQREQIVDFVYERDAEDISKIICDDWNWIFPHENIKHRDKALSKELWKKNRAGELNIKVLRNKERVIGLISFRKKSADVDRGGNIRIISIAKDFRGKGYDRKLIIAALNDLFDSGCTSAYLFTHKDNEKVRTYESLGFEKAEISQDDIAWFKEANISADDYPRYVVNKETFKPYAKK
ncbi:GNAT family N-acetyltransferase, partial [Candidatus Dependentiae bacterium]